MDAHLKFTRNNAFSGILFSHILFGSEFYFRF